ncbi:MAG: gephyrin-like molybdotransferase Glp, partial [Phycicoccus sp.]
MTPAPAGLRSVAEHRAAVLGLVAPLAAEPVRVGRALGRVLAADVVAAVDLPGTDNSAMDGYAVQAMDLAGASDEHPVALPVDGDVAAGDTARHVLAPGRALRIMTGAPLPEGA